MTFPSKTIVAAAALGLCLASATAIAQDMTPASAASSMGHMKGMMHHGMGMHHDMNNSMHMMSATVSSVDAKTGLVEVNTAGMSLRLHFPPPSVAGLKAGDKITLHMGFSKP